MMKNKKIKILGIALLIASCSSLYSKSPYVTADCEAGFLELLKTEAKAWSNAGNLVFSNEKENTSPAALKCSNSTSPIDLSYLNDVLDISTLEQGCRDAITSGQWDKAFSYLCSDKNLHIIEILLELGFFPTNPTIQSYVFSFIESLPNSRYVLKKVTLNSDLEAKYAEHISRKNEKIDSNKHRQTLLGCLETVTQRSLKSKRLETLRKVKSRTERQSELAY